ncbi:Carbamoyl-phosphate synthase large chain [Clostridium sp. N3C]|uniref:carbamoyl-phosphate synthase large subunit n=1 Tax=Clostridium sp. N3C TaxID=1776758 RepID=UPI00092DFFDC|nr:carbamoyl-phosphate synthase large subunit [Clostridium sp. N3C]SCN21236.1 Carbamoyl-phosphate synthase large chain [Clostridium sp. N3C]
MPLDKNIKKVLVIGSGPIVIGQAAEFDYAGTQACRVLRKEGIEIVLVNSNPATIMTDKNIADKIYIEPLTLTTIKRIIEKERPDSILSGLGGQTGLTLCMQLAKEGFLDKMNVRLLGSSPETIDKAEDRQLFKETMEKIGEPVIPSIIATDVSTAVEFAEENGYPVIIRPAFTLGGSGGGIANNKDELLEIARNGLSLSPIHQILVEKSIAGWKEIEFEVMRDRAGNVITVCSMENFDPVGVHTGDSIVIAPAVTLADKEYQMLRSAALNIITALEVEGGCNCQFALHPHSFEYAVIEVNPRVSRSSALASKATGYPIAKVATKIAIGYTLDEIKNDVTGTTFAAFEPTLDYVAVKLPKWPFDKFVYAKKELSTQMKATGEVMAIADTFEEALLKAVRGAEIGLNNLDLKRLKNKSDSEIMELLSTVTDERLFLVYEAILRALSKGTVKETIDEIHLITKIDRWFLYALKNIAEGKVKTQSLSYKMVDTCGGEFEAKTPYFYSISNSVENEALPFVERSKKERILVLGSGPIRIGQGIEFDYASVHCVWTLKKMGYEVIVINNNPETVSTDFDTGDRLYFEPLCIDDVMSVVDIEKPIGVIVAFGGGTAIKLAQKLHQRGVNIIGTSAESIDICEDRKRFDDLLEGLGIKRPKGYGVLTKEEALDAAEKLGYPVLLRPSYVLGGQNMIIAFSPEDVKEYMDIILRQKQDNPVLIDKYLAGLEIEVDAISDGVDVLIPGIMEHIERTGIHSGDSIAVYPAPNVDDQLAQKIYEETKRLCMALNVKGLVNIQYVLYDNDIYVIEVNPRASRTVPYLSKVTGVPMCELATRVSVGESLSSLGYSSGIAKIPPYVAVKVPVFSFEKLTDLDTHLGPEMKSTGEVLGIGKNIEEALYKGLIAAGYKMHKSGGVFLTVRDSDKIEIRDIAKKFYDLGFKLYATRGTAKVLASKGFDVEVVNKIHECEENNTVTLLESGKISYIISTSAKGRNPATDDVKIRRKACLLGIPCLTSIDTANALADCLLSGYSEINTELININNLRRERMKINFTKMQGCGNDYIYINCIGNAATDGMEINSPESLSVYLSDRHFGVGGDGIVLILPSNVADAKMRMFNLDGSEGKMCGNAIRCVAKYLYDNGIVKKEQISIETLSGIKELQLFTQNGAVSKVKVNMGKAELRPENIPVSLEGDSIINRKVSINDKEYAITCVSMGNPHAVVFCDEEINEVELDSFKIDEIGPLFENNEIFPERVNTEFVKVLERNRLKMRVWERGSGETLACGTGACASAVAAVLNGYCDKDTDITVELLGGELTIRYTDDAVYMTGDCKKVFEGTVEI